VRFLQQGKWPARERIPVSRASVARRLRGGGHSSTLTTQILLGSLSLLVLTVVLGGFLFTMISNQTLDRQYQLRALGIATTTAQMPEIRSALAAGDPGHVIAGLAREITAAAQSSYVVVTDRDGIRFSHPAPALIGQKLEEPVAVLDGKTHVGFDLGSLGTSANAKAPIFGVDGSVIGQVSVGIEDTQVLDTQVQNIWLIAGFSALVLALGVGRFAVALPPDQTCHLQPGAGRDHLPRCKSARRCCTGSGRPSSGLTTTGR